MRFTPREVQILDRMRLGEPYKQIAHQLGMCEGSVKVYMSRMYHRESFNGPKHALALYVEWRCSLAVWGTTHARLEQNEQRAQYTTNGYGFPVGL